MKSLQHQVMNVHHKPQITNSKTAHPICKGEYKETAKTTCSGNFSINSNGDQVREPNSENGDQGRMQEYQSPASFRKSVRAKAFTGPTNGVCPGYIQCNLVVLKQKDAFDFLLFCQRNKQACPLIEVLDVGSYSPFQSCKNSVNEDGTFADLRKDIPKYRIYKYGKLVKETDDVTEHWPEDSVAFLIGCSFTTDAALLEASIRLRTVEEKKNVPMFKTNIPCTAAGALHGNMVVSMKPIRCVDIAKEVQITSEFPHAHGAPVCVGCPAAIGIQNIMEPDFGDAVEVRDDELPVFHACGVTPQNIILESQAEFAITHSPGHMLVTDLLADKPL